jgi:hypothetical protein
MSLTGLLLGLINIVIVVAILLLVGALIQWALQAIASIAIPANIVKLYLVIVALIAIYLLVALLLGMPSVRIIGFHGIAGPTVVGLSAGAAAYL